uniref:SRCR domain-containing protein n=1 Tax=Trichuris muris TaxID=70415 RepID=A0A5S6QKI3_TRIMR
MATTVALVSENCVSEHLRVSLTPGYNQCYGKINMWTSCDESLYVSRNASICITLGYASLSGLRVIN